MAKDYYLVLGVGPSATSEQIRSAYRKKAKKLHPDRTGGRCETFQAVQEAYEVLGDPARRRAYDAQLTGAGHAAHASTGAHPERPRRRRYPVEPVGPRQRRTGPEIGFFGPPLRPLVDAFFIEPWDVLHPATHSRAGAARHIHFKVYLTPDEARVGGRLRTSIPVRTKCPSCRGQGRGAFFACPRCQGRGILDGEYPVEITYPPAIAHRSTWTVALRQPDLDETLLELHFQVGEP
jgi:DnaJ-class molecular chaperone